MFSEARGETTPTSELRAALRISELKNAGKYTFLARTRETNWNCATDAIKVINIVNRSKLTHKNAYSINECRIYKNIRFDTPTQKHFHRRFHLDLTHRPEFEAIKVLFLTGNTI